MPAPARKPPAKKAAPKKPTAAEAAFDEANPPAATDDLPSGKMLLEFRGEQFIVPTQAALADDFRFRMAVKAGDDSDCLVALVGNDVAVQMWKLVDPEKDTFHGVILEFFEAYEKATNSGNS
jgi:hypothetical protein